MKLGLMFVTMSIKSFTLVSHPPCMLIEATTIDVGDDCLSCLLLAREPCVPVVSGTRMVARTLFFPLSIESGRLPTCSVDWLDGDLLPFDD